MMDTLIADFTKELRHSIEIAKNATLTKADNEIRNVLVSGLGGSGFGANLTRELVGAELKVPFLVNKGYFMPNFVDKHTLAIVSSYSGNTEETTNVFSQILETGAKVTCVSSGGKVIDVAKEKSLDHVMLPGGRPPRASLGYSFVQQLNVLNFHGLISDTVLNDLNTAVDLLDEKEEEIKAEAKALAEKLYTKMPVLYVIDEYGSVAIRWRQQINENSKMLCWHHVIPEMNHNELVGWRTEDDNLAVVVLRNEDDFSRVQQRIGINKETFGKYTPNIHDVYSKGNSKTEKALYLIHLGDWLSYYMAELRGVDATEVKVIDSMKGELAKLDW